MEKHKVEARPPLLLLNVERVTSLMANDKPAALFTLPLAQRLLLLLLPRDRVLKYKRTRCC